MNLTGAAFGDALQGTSGRDYIYPGEKGLDYFKPKNLKLERLPLKWERSQHELMGPPNERDLKAVKNFAKAAEERSLFVILDMHNYGRRSLDGKKQEL